MPGSLYIITLLHAMITVYYLVCRAGIDHLCHSGLVRACEQQDFFGIAKWHI